VGTFGNRGSKHSREPRLDGLILREIGRAGKRGITAWEIERNLRAEIGIVVHQAVTGNLRHLVERGSVVALRSRRFFAKMRRRVYVTDIHYDPAVHGAAVLVGRRARIPTSEAERARCRRMIANAKAGSLYGRIREMIRQHTDGLTCRELEVGLDRSHQSISARLAELTSAGFLLKTGRKRRHVGETRALTVYQLANDSEPRTTDLFDEAESRSWS
jgi:hypothetical protein